MGRTDFSDQFRKLTMDHKRIDYNLNVMRQSACVVFNPITVDNFDRRRWIGRQTPVLNLDVFVYRDDSLTSVECYHANRTTN